MKKILIAALFAGMTSISFAQAVNKNVDDVTVQVLSYKVSLENPFLHTHYSLIASDTGLLQTDDSENVHRTAVTSGSTHINVGALRTSFLGQAIDNASQEYYECNFEVAIAKDGTQNISLANQWFTEYNVCKVNQEVLQVNQVVQLGRDELATFTLVIQDS